MTTDADAKRLVQNLLRVPLARRDQAWFHHLFAQCERTIFVRSTTPGFINQLRLPFHNYEMARARRSTDAPRFAFRQIIENALVSGAGLRLFSTLGGDEGAALSTYGLLWSYYQFGDVNGDPLDAPDSVMASLARAEYARQKQGEGRYVLPINEQYMPRYVRRGLYPFLKAYSKQEPIVAMLVDQTKAPLRTMLFGIDSKKLADAQDLDWLRQSLLPFCMPLNRYFFLATEKDPVSRYMAGMVIDPNLVAPIATPAPKARGTAAAKPAKRRATRTR
jgi:hypothetical protein